MRNSVTCVTHFHTDEAHIAVCRGDAFDFCLVAQRHFFLEIQQSLRQLVHIEIRLAEPANSVGKFADVAPGALYLFAFLEGLDCLVVFFEGDEDFAVSLQHIRKVFVVLALAVDFESLLQEFLPLEKLLALVIRTCQVIERVVEDFGFVDLLCDAHGLLQILLSLIELVDVDFAQALVCQCACQGVGVLHLFKQLHCGIEIRQRDFGKILADDALIESQAADAVVAECNAIVVVDLRKQVHRLLEARQCAVVFVLQK